MLHAADNGIVWPLNTAAWQAGKAAGDNTNPNGAQCGGWGAKWSLQHLAITAHRFHELIGKAYG